VENSQYSITKLLLELGASPHVMNSYGYFPIHIAAKIGKDNFCTLLVKNKADVNSKTPSNLTPLHIASKLFLLLYSFGE
jgi:ankyrin repeat protein